MRCRMWCVALVASALLGLGVTGAWAQDFSVEATVDRTAATLDDQILLEITVRGQFRGQPPSQPAIEDFEIYYRGHSQSVSIVNGAMDAAHTFSYVLVPKREGELVIPPFTVQHRGEPYRTEPIRIRVAASLGGGGTPGAGRDLFVVARVDKERVYVNEQVLYTLSLYAAVQFSNLSYPEPPQFPGFWVEKLQEGERQYHKIVDGRRYLVIEASTALFPTTSGTLTIPPVHLRLLELAERSFSFFDRGVERSLRSRAVDVQVLPLPANGKPRDFDGAVGEDLELVADLDRTEVEEGEPISVTVRVEGTGNVRTFSKPRLPELPQFKVYDADTKTEVRSLDRVTGSRTYEIVLVPREAGEYTLPPVRFSYFDTRSGTYRTLETQPRRIVAVRTARSQQRLADAQPPIQKDIEVMGEDIAHIRTDVPIADAATPLYARGIFLFGAPMPLLALGAAFVLQRRRDKLAADVALARSTRARKVARRRLSAADSSLRAGRSAEFYAEVARAVLQYVGDKLNVSAAGLTHAALRQRLADAGASEDLRERLVQVLEHCDAARFAPGVGAVERMRSILQEVESLVTEMEESWNRKTARFAPAAALGITLCYSLVSGFGLVCAGVPVVRAQPATADSTSAPAPSSSVEPSPDAAVRLQAEPRREFAPPQDQLRRGDAAYEAGRFAEAIEAYREAERMGVRNGPLYYNLGNSFFKNSELGQAIACYRRAERLIPRDERVRANLEFVLARRQDKPVRSPTPWPVAAARAAFRCLSLNEWVGATTLLYVLACGLALYIVLRRSRRFGVRLGLYATLGLFLLAASTLAVKVHEERGVQRGVIAVDKASVMSGPGRDYTVEFWIHEGTEVTIEDHRPEWLRISLGGNLEGWLPAHSVVRI